MQYRINLIKLSNRFGILRRARRRKFVGNRGLGLICVSDRCSIAQPPSPHYHAYLDQCQNRVWLLNYTSLLFSSIRWPREILIQVSKQWKLPCAYGMTPRHQAYMINTHPNDNNCCWPCSILCSVNCEVGFIASHAHCKDHSRFPWWRHPMETFSALLAICAGNSPVTGEFPAQRPVTRSYDVFFDLRLNKRLSKQSWAWWF